MIEKIADILRRRGATLAVAESCTGGRLAAAFTAEAGASDFFVGGVVAYSNDVKARVLGVSSDDLALHGAVSRPVAEQMAAGVRRVTGADCSIATTGIAGPGGGTPEKPLGTVWIAVSVPDAVPVSAPAHKTASAPVTETASTLTPTISRLFHFTGTREEIMNQSVTAAIELFYSSIR